VTEVKWLCVNVYLLWADHENVKKLIALFRSQLKASRVMSLPPRIELEEFHGLSLNINLDGRRVGFIDAWEDPEVERGVWVEYVYVLERHRNSGVGTRAMGMALSMWRGMGYEVVSLDDVHWEQPDNFWDRLGFRGEGKRKQLRF
jgi:GNAT superfamily N-acetyltransferase